MYKEHIKPIVVLVAICIVVSGMLAGANMLTAPIIAAADLERAEATRKQMLPEATSFVSLDTTVSGVKSVYADEGGTGFVIESTGNGNNGPVSVTVGIDSLGRVIAVVIGAHSEDAGIGTKAFDSKYLDSFAGLSGDVSHVDSVSGATYSSKAVKQAINLALEAYNEVKLSFAS